jgi:hypothetical protein
MKYGVLEQKRYEEGTVAPGPNNHVIVAVVLAIWTETFQTTLKLAEKEDWPIAQRAHASCVLQGYSVQLGSDHLDGIW